MRVSILQPSYLPWLGYFEMLYNSDVFVLYDDVQYDKDGWRNRNRIRNGSGWAWLTVPVKTADRSHQAINAVEIDNSYRWAVKHMRAFATNYARAPETVRLTEALGKIIYQRWDRLADLNQALIERICSILGPGHARIVRASKLGVPDCERSERLMRICQALGADTYYATKASRDYLSVDPFLKNEIKVEFQDYQHPTYPQVQRGAFISHLSVVDLMANCGNLSLEVLRGKA